MLAIVLKLLGILITTSGAVLALIGETTKDHKLTSRGTLAMGLVIVGFFTSMATEFTAAYSSKTSERWEVAKSLPITVVIYSILSKKPQTATELVATLNKMKVSYVAFTGADALVRNVSLHWEFDPTKASVEEATTLELVSSRGRMVASRTSLSLRTSMGWSTSVLDDWTQDNFRTNVGGIESRVSWQDHGFGPSLSEVGQLSRLNSFSVIVPDENYLDQFEKVTITFLTVGEASFTLDLKRLSYLKFTDTTLTPNTVGRSAILDGATLIDMWRGSVSL
ncbi:MAG: hypothetical protein ABI771_13550 [Betaproteobacteria bacterium]